VSFPKLTAPALTAGVFALITATRLSVAPKYLYFFDSVNFALALDEFNPSKHQPQPPGYPMFVALLKVLHVAIPDAQHVLLAAGIVVATAAAMLLWRLTHEMFGAEAAVLALSIFLFTPPCWFGGVTNQVRVSLALCSSGVALLAWRALQRPHSAARLYLTFAALGLAAGFRPALAALLTPLLLWVWWKTGHSIRRLLISGVFGAAATAPWMTPTVMAVGGFPQWLTLMWTYSNDQFRGSSLPFGAALKAAWKMAAQALAWNGLAAVAWIWAVPFVWPRDDAPARRSKGVFIAVWALPILLFSALIHIGDPDQALGSIPALCVIGGAVMAAFLRRIASRRLAFAAVAMAAVNALMFFNPPGRLAAASSYNAVAAVDRRTRDVFKAVIAAKGDGPAAILDYKALVTWRHLSYYFYDHPVMNLDPDPKGYSWVVQHRETVYTMHPADKLPGPRRVILLAPSENAIEMLGAGWHKQGPVYYRDVEPGAQIAIGPYTLLQPPATSETNSMKPALALHGRDSSKSHR
jgi:hypothetical protein